MPVTAVVLTLRPEATERERLLAALDRDTRIELGEAAGNCLPLVLDVPDEREGAALLRDMEGWGGVAQVQVAAVYFEEYPGCGAGGGE